MRSVRQAASWRNWTIQNCISLIRVSENRRSSRGCYWGALRQVDRKNNIKNLHFAVSPKERRIFCVIERSSSPIHGTDMSLHRCLDEQTVLVTAVVVVINVIFNSGNQLFPAGECLSVIAFTFQDSPEALHRAIVNTAANTGHTLRHSGIQQLLVESSAGVLESTVTVEQWVSIWIFQNSFIKRIKNQLVVIPVTNNIADNSPVTQIEDCAQIELVDNRPSYHLNSVTSVSHFSFGLPAQNSRCRRFCAVTCGSEAFLVQPCFLNFTVDWI